MAVLNGTDLVVKWGTAGSEVKTACSTSCTLNINQAVTEATCKDNTANWSGGVEGIKSWDVSTDGLYDPDATGGFTDLGDIIITGPNEVSLVFGTEEVGGIIYTGTAIVTACSVTGAVNETSTYSASFTGTGALVKSVVA